MSNVPTNDQTAPPRPLPDTEDPLSKPFWAAARAHQLVVQRCRDCGTFRFPPELGCYQCGSSQSDWTPVSGRGKLQSWTVLHPPVLPFFKDKTPWPVAVVELAEGVRLCTNLIDVPLAEYRIDMPVTVAFEDQPGTDVTLIMFRRAN